MGLQLFLVFENEQKLSFTVSKNNRRFEFNYSRDCTTLFLLSSERIQLIPLSGSSRNSAKLHPLGCIRSAKSAKTGSAQHPVLDPLKVASAQHKLHPLAAAQDPLATANWIRKPCPKNKTDSVAESISSANVCLKSALIPLRNQSGLSRSRTLADPDHTHPNRNVRK